MGLNKGNPVKETQVSFKTFLFCGKSYELCFEWYFSKHNIKWPRKPSKGNPGFL
jgi:hypothetical protein